MKKTLLQRVENYNCNKKKSWSPLLVHNDVVCGFWWFGRWYNTSRAFGNEYFYGAYPYGFWERLALLFQDRLSGRVLHLFSGTLQSVEERITTFDINPKLNPNVVGDAELVSQFFSPGYFDLIAADPPYEKNYLVYGTAPFSRKKVLRECAGILKPGGYLVWLDTLVPQWRKVDDWVYKGNIGIAQSTNHRVRALTILQRREVEDA